MAWTAPTQPQVQNPYLAKLNPPKPFDGKGDHDGDGKTGGAKKPAKK